MIPYPLDEETKTNVVGAGDSYITAMAWCLREIEVADLDASTRNIDLLPGGAVALKLPMSKSDQKGAGAVRTLSCHCHLDTYDVPAPQASCGPCAVRRQLDRLKEQFDITFDSDAAQGYPLFPSGTGARPSKAITVQAWSLILEAEARGHTPRRSGAKMRARTGWSVWQIQFFARWAGATVLEYIEEALAQTTLNWSAQAPSASSSASDVAAVAGRSVVERLVGDSSLEALVSLTARTDAAEKALADLRLALPDPTAGISESMCFEVDATAVVTSSKSHYLPHGATEWPRPMWTALCGWKFGSSSASNVSLIPISKLGALAQPMCGKCEKRHAKGTGQIVGDV